MTGDTVNAEHPARTVAKRHSRKGLNTTMAMIVWSRAPPHHLIVMMGLPPRQTRTSPTRGINRFARDSFNNVIKHNKIETALRAKSAMTEITMGWTCKACTYVNTATPESGSCEMCGKKRPLHSSADNGNGKKAPRTTVQATLLGGVVAKKDPMEGKKKKRKAGTSINSSAAPSSKALADSSAPPAKKPTPVSSLASTSSLPMPAQARARQGTLSFGQGIHSNKEWQGLCCPRVANTSQMEHPALKDRIKRALRLVFGVKKLRLLQPAAVQCALKGQSQLLVMATGGGKSICYQLPAVVMGGTCIVISPLIALMQDQVSALLKKNVQAAVLSSASGERQNKHIVERLLGRPLGASKKNAKDPPLQHITLLYVTPEQVKTKRFRDVLTEMHKEGKLSLFAVDEAHWCVGQFCSP
jgi:hypothetical protein